MYPFSSKDMIFDQCRQRCQCCGAGPHPASQGGRIQRNSFTGKGCRLPVQGLLVRKLPDQDRGQKVRSRPSADKGMEWGWQLGNGLAVPTAALLAYCLDNPEPARNDLKGFRDALTQFRQSCQATAGTLRWGGNDNARAAGLTEGVCVRHGVVDQDQ